MTTPQLKNTIGNAAALAVGTGLDSILQFIFIWIVSRELGPETFGYYSYLVASLTFVQVVVQFGLHPVVVREIAAAGSNSKTKALLLAMFGIRSTLAVLCLVLVMAATFLFEPIQSHRSAAIIIFGVLLFFPWDLQPLFDGLGQARWDVPGRLIGRSISLILLILILIVKNGLALSEVAVSFSANTLVLTIAGWHIARRRGILPELLSHAELRRAEWAATVRRETKRLFKLAIPIAWATLAATVFVFSQTILVKWFSTPLETGYYGLAARLILPALMVKGILYRLILQLLSEVKEERSRFEYRLERLLPALALIFMPATAIAIPLCEILIVPVFGMDYSGSILPAQISLSHLFLTGAGSLLGTALFALGFQKTYTWSQTAACVASLVAGVLLIPKLGAIGGSWATVIAEMTALVITIPPFMTQARPKVWSRLFRIAISSLLIIAGYYGCRHGLDMKPIYSLFAGTLIGLTGLWWSGEISRERMNIIVGMFRRKTEDAETQQIP